jgi:Fe-S-cluster-containing dehydrogenase component/formate-dependent nitrite reductase membrane component NrfD
MNYGFLIDNRRCIGCHACSIACKAEHEVPPGNFRTWVKYVERGEFPSVRRHFTVLRCNHCGDAPCVHICPTRALFYREDGIVDYDRRHCIGCKSCMAACPYDALYLNAHTEVAEKCNYCAHRIDRQLEPACVTACPVGAIVTGDIDDTESRIGRLIAGQETRVRRPELNTEPKVYYIEADAESLIPGAVPRDRHYLCSERLPEVNAASGNGHLARTVYDIPRRIPWGKLVPWYFWTKALATGPILISALLLILGGVRAPELFGLFVPMFSILMGFTSTLFFIGDLEHPERYLKTLVHPNFRSWQVWGSYLLIVFIGYMFLWAIAGIYGRNAPMYPLLWPGVLIASLVAGHSGSLLRQARGRDLWSSRFAFPHLVVQSCLAGSAALALATVFRGSGRSLTDLFLRLMLGCVCLHGGFTLAKITRPGGTQERRAAIRFMVQGPLAAIFWAGAVFAGIAIPVYQLAWHFYALPSGSTIPVIASASALLGLLAWQDCYVRAGQALPLS